MSRALMKPLMLALSMIGAPACGGDGSSFEHAALGISANKEGAPEGPVGCEKLPLLRGSRAISRYVIDEQFDVLIDSTPEQAHVSFVMDGMELTPPVVVLAHDLDDEFMQEKTFLVDDLQYTVRIVSGCAE